MRIYLTVAAAFLVAAVPAVGQDIVRPRTAPVDDTGCQIQGLDPKGDGFLALRSGPGSEYSKVGEAHNGDALYLGAECEGRWCFARGGAIGGREMRFEAWFYDAWCMWYP